MFVALLMCGSCIKFEFTILYSLQAVWFQLTETVTEITVNWFKINQLTETEIETEIKSKIETK